MFDVLEHCDDHWREGCLGARLFSEPDRCKEEIPEAGKGCPPQALGNPGARTSVLYEYSTRLSEVHKSGITLCPGRVKPFQEPTCRACD
jgi:hypothetical protein